MFVCTTYSLKLRDRVVFKGDPVPEAASWDEAVRRAHLELGYIAWLDSGAVNATVELAPAKKRGRPRKTAEG